MKQKNISCPFQGVRQVKGGREAGRDGRTDWNLLNPNKQQDKVESLFNERLFNEVLGLSI